MDNIQIFTMALGLQPPWHVSKAEFLLEDGLPTLNLYIDHQPSAKFVVDGEACSIYDHVNRKWRHLNFFQHKCYLHAKVPRVKTSDGGTVQVEVPWAERGSGFTLLFEGYAMWLVKNGMSLSAGGELMGVEGRVLGRIIQNRVAQALADQSLEQVVDLGIDETSFSKGHDYVTILTDKEAKKVVGIGNGKDAQAVRDALCDMEIRGADKEAVETVSLDFSAAFISACNKHLGQAEMVFDRYHLDSLLSKAVDKVRREDQKHNDGLKRTRYLWLHNNENLDEAKRALVAQLEATFPRIGLAYRLKEQFKEVFREADPALAMEHLKLWVNKAAQSALKPICEFTQTVTRHWDGITAYFRLSTTNAYSEAVNLKIQEIKRIARGYRNRINFHNMIYFHLGKLDLKIKC
jgi:transposase